MSIIFITTNKNSTKPNVDIHIKVHPQLYQNLHTKNSLSFVKLVLFLLRQHYVVKLTGYEQKNLFESFSCHIPVCNAFIFIQ